MGQRPRGLILRSPGVPERTTRNLTGRLWNLHLGTPHSQPTTLLPLQVQRKWNVLLTSIFFMKFSSLPFSSKTPVILFFSCLSNHSSEPPSPSFFSAHQLAPHDSILGGWLLSFSLCSACSSHLLPCLLLRSVPSPTSPRSSRSHSSSMCLWRR